MRPPDRIRHPRAAALARAAPCQKTICRPWSWPKVGGTLLLVFLYAASDEFHQIFVPTRTPLVSDVFIDTAGGAIGLARALVIRPLPETAGKIRTMKRPLVAVVSCYVAGLLLAEIFQPPLAALFAASFLVLVLVLVLEKFRPLLIWPLLALAGWTNLAFHTAVISPNDLRDLDRQRSRHRHRARNFGRNAAPQNCPNATTRKPEHSLAQVRVDRNAPR